MRSDLASAEETWKKAERLKKNAEDLKKAYGAAREAFTRTNSAYTEKQNAFLDAQAGYLAREALKPGMPCPVCGSKEHPQPAVLSEEQSGLTREMLEELKNSLFKLREEQERDEEYQSVEDWLLTQDQSKL